MNVLAFLGGIATTIALEAIAVIVIAIVRTLDD